LASKSPQSSRATVRRLPNRSAAHTPILSEALFSDALARERKRSDRSLDGTGPLLVTVAAAPAAAWMWRAIGEALTRIRRDEDVVGWLRKSETLGLLLPDIPTSDVTFVRSLEAMIHREIFDRVGAHADARVSIRLWGHTVCDADIEPFDAIYRATSEARRPAYAYLKRVIDVVLSAALMVILAPVFAAVAALVKLTSPGPVLFRQQRVGRSMVPFMMLKFRTMQVNADHGIHKQFVSSFITGQGVDALEGGLFKITNDPRVTPIGRVLRKTSLDELPQLWNVLRGEMSLVGPRPPLAYEVEQYKAWHLRRVLDATPGLTGLWQVSGRSRMTFDEMVRLDLRYVRSSSFWTDIKILLATPRAVISGKGAC
jgi:lipopolysaccharide/colanic/teichoic acid biosynthesis glycosyltransferase